MTDTIEYLFPVKEGAEGRDSVRILEDADGDGRAEKVTVFASGLNLPIGIILADGAIALSIPKIWKADRPRRRRQGGREEGALRHLRVRGYHGPTGSFSWGFDGWIYAHHGCANHVDTRRRWVPIQLQSGNTYRFRADGLRVEQYTHGQVNPFGLCSMRSETSTRRTATRSPSTCFSRAPGTRASGSPTMAWATARP